MNFDNQMAIITGGAQGLGRACAERILKAGGRVAIWDRDIALAEETAAALGPQTSAFEVNVADWDSVRAGFAASCAVTGRVDVVINSAGIAGSNATVEDYDVAEFALIQQVNLMGTFHVNKAAVAQMKQQSYGRILNISSVAGKEGNPNASAYSASKAGVIGFTKSLGKELAGFDIAVNCVTPAAARTAIFDQMSQEHIDFMLSKIPRGRFLETAEAAEMMVWLVSRENSFTTGGVFDLSGGRATY